MSAPSISAMRRRPPIFVRRGAPFLYVAHEPSAAEGEGILVPKDSAIKTVADLKVRKSRSQSRSPTSGTRARKRRAEYTDIQPTFWHRPTRAPAFERGSVDAVIWDPFQARG